MPVYQGIENILGLKALAWDFDKGRFISPAAKDFTWHPNGLVVAQCRNHCQPENIPGESCTCGMYASYSIHVVAEYTVRWPIAPVFLVEASGKTIFYSAGWRSKEMTLTAVAPYFRYQETFRKLSSYIDPGMSQAFAAAHQAADHFQIPYVDDIITLQTIMDLWNVCIRPGYKPFTDAFKDMQKEQILSIARERLTEQFNVPEPV
jgi:hypothetical protein